MLGMRHVYHVSPFASTPHRSSPGYAHPPPSPWSYEGFRKPENEKSYTIKLFASITHVRTALFASEPAIIRLGLQSTGLRPHYLPLRAPGMCSCLICL